LRDIPIKDSLYSNKFRKRREKQKKREMKNWRKPEAKTALCRCCYAQHLLYILLNARRMHQK
jgi:hypothetical protein